MNLEQKKTVLVVEDELPLLAALVDEFTRLGLTVLEAKDGKEALAIALEKHPDVILLDLLLPEMDGMTMLAKLREDDWGKGARVIICSNVSTIEMVAQGVELGSYEYLAKADWKIEDVVNKVKTVLGA